MKRFLFFVLMTFFLCEASFADTVIIPFSCYPKEIVKGFAKYNKKVDLSANDRTKDSWAFIRSNGSNYEICIYGPVSQKDFDIITKVAFSQK